MPIPDQYKTKHLLLLMGENPLPNYVCAKLLLLPGGTAHLVCSTETQEIADRLGKLLESEGFQYQHIQIEDEESNGFAINRKIINHLKSIPSVESLGLNYTGGTKVMSAHAYQAILEKAPQAIFSYLNPRALELCIDERANQTTHLFPVGIEVQPAFENILKLHNLTLLSIGNVNNILDNIADDFAEYIAGNYSDNFQTKSAWCDWHTSRGEDPKTVSTSLELSLDNFQQWQNKGTWLEHYVFKQVIKLAELYHLHDLFMSIRVQDPRKKARKKDTEEEKEQERFEFDVSFLRGYQLFGITCGASANRGGCKEKLIEADLRAKQLGGSEARIALVCCYSDAEDLKEEIRLMGIDPKIEVFDREDLDPDTFSAKLETWIQRNIKD